MKAWRLDRLGGTLRLEDAPVPEPRSGGGVLRVEASALMSYLKAYVEGRLPIYSPPDGRDSRRPRMRRSEAVLNDFLQPSAFTPPAKAALRDR
jgi:hypothetical protein